MWVLLIVGIGVRVPSRLNYGGEAQSSHFLISQIDTIRENEKKSDLSWIITEPLGGLVGGVVGRITGALLLGLIGTGIDKVLGKYGDYGGPCTWVLLVGGKALGWIIGVSWGICKVGKWLEKEEGCFKKTLLGSGVGEVVGLGIAGLIWLVHPEVEGGPVSVLWWSSPIIGGMVGYRLSLRKK